jgi:hypothetical protein
MKKFFQKIPKNIKILVLAIIAVLVVVCVVKAIVHKRPHGDAPVMPAVTIDQEPTPMPAPKHIRRRGGMMQQATLGDYTALVAQYASRRVQFGTNCQATPMAVTYKVGTQIMLDNRTNTASVLAFGGKTYNLTAYGYQIITLDTEGTYLVDCGGQQNVATIVVQK